MIFIYPIIALVGLAYTIGGFGHLPAWGIFVGVGVFCLFSYMTWLEYREMVPAGSIEEDPESKRDWRSFLSFVSIFGLFASDSDDSDFDDSDSGDSDSDDSASDDSDGSDSNADSGPNSGSSEPGTLESKK